MSVEFENGSLHNHAAQTNGGTSSFDVDEAEVSGGDSSASASPLPSPSSDADAVVDSRPEVDQMAEFPELELDDSSAEAEQQNNNHNNAHDGDDSKSQVLMQKLRIENEESGNHLQPTTTTTTKRTTTNNIGKLLKSPNSDSNDGSWIKQKKKEDVHAIKISVSDEMAALQAENNDDNNNNDGSSSPEVKLWGPPPPAKEFADAENQCFRCHDKIYPNDAIHGPLKGVFFHQKCFLCFECNRRLNLTSYFHSREDVKDMRIFCGQHQPKAQGSGYGMDSLDFKGPKIETERVTANIFGGPQMAKGGTFDAQALGISQYTKNAQKLGNPNSNIRGGPEASKSANIDYQSMGIRGVVDNYRKQAAPNSNIRGGPDASRSAKLGMDSMDMKAATGGPKRDYNINKNIKGGPEASKSSGFGTDSLAMKGVTRDPKNKQAAGDSIVRGGADAQKSASIGVDSLHIRACTEHRQSLQVSNRNVRGVPEPGTAGKIDAESWEIKSALVAPKGGMGGNLRSKVAASSLAKTANGEAGGEEAEEDEEERERALSRQSNEPAREDDVQVADVKNIRKMFEN